MKWLLFLKSVSIRIKSPGIFGVTQRDSALKISQAWAFVRCSIKAVHKSSCLTSIHTKSFHRISPPCKNISHWILKQVKLSVMIVLFFGPPTAPELISQPLTREAQVTEWWQVVVSWRGIGQAWKTGPLSAQTYFYSSPLEDLMPPSERGDWHSFSLTFYAHSHVRTHTHTHTHTHTLTRHYCISIQKKLLCII